MTPHRTPDRAESAATGAASSAAGAGRLDRRRLLMVANPFPPLASGGNARQVRFARFLPEYGWDVTVLTVRAQGPAPVPEGLRVERAAAPGPDSLYRTARRATRAFRRTADRPGGGEEAVVSGDRVLPVEPTAEADLAHRSPSGREAAATSETGAGDPPRGVQRRSSRRGAVNDWLFVPDEWAGWIGPALMLGRRLLRDERYDAIMSSFPRPSTELVASILARESGLPWLADYRDPWATRHLRHYPTPLHRRAHYALEEWALHPAAAVTATAEPIAASLRHRFPLLADRVSVLPNGYDPFDDPSPPADLGEGFWLVHTGRLYGRSEQLRRVLHAFAALPPEVQLLFVGVEGGEIRRQAADLDVSERVHTVPFVPHHVALAYQRAADGLVLITGNAPEALSSKVFEYLAAGRPIFAFIPARSAARDLLDECGGAVIAAQNEPPDALLRRFVDQARSGAVPPPDGAAVARYDGRTLTRRLGALLDCLADQTEAHLGRRPAHSPAHPGAPVAGPGDRP